MSGDNDNASLAGAPVSLTHTDPRNVVTKYNYDFNGNLNGRVRASGELNQTDSASYSPSNKILSATDPAGYVTSFSYDGLDRLQTLTDGAHRVTTFNYDADGRLWTVSNGAVSSSPLVTRLYGADGELTRLTDGDGHVTTYAYDPFVRRASSAVSGVANTVRTYAYDTNDNPTALGTPAGTVNYGYDALNRLISKSPAGEAAVSYGYDLAGHLTSAALAGANAFAFGYDTAGRQISETRSDGKQTSWQFDGVGNRTLLTWPDGYSVGALYDRAYRMTTISRSPVTLASYGYDDLNRRISTAYGNGASAGYSYATGNDDLTNLNYAFTGDASAGTSSYSLSFGYGYNGAHQHLTETTSDGRFAAEPAQGSASYGYNAANQITGFGYDANGNLANDGQLTYGYDAENRLISTSGLGHTSSYAYDPLGRRASKTVDGLTTAFLSAGDQTIGDLDGSGNMLRRYIWGAGTDEALATVNVSSGGIVGYAHTDGLGSVIAMSNSAGQMSERYVYDSWGNTATPSGNPYRYAGMRLDAETGLYHDRARTYCAPWGRFCQMDPLGPDALGRGTWYDYCYDDPVNCTDPSGLFGQTASKAYSLFQPLIPGGQASNQAFALAGKGYYGAAALTFGRGVLEAGLAVATFGESSIGLQAGRAAISSAEGAGLSGTALARSLGQAGEDAVGITGPKVSIEIPGSGQIRIPDALTDSTLTEVKNVGSLSYTQQLRDFATYSQATGRDFQLFVRPSTRLSGPLQQAITDGVLQLNFIPGAP